MNFVNRKVSPKLNLREIIAVLDFRRRKNEKSSNKEVTWRVVEE
jgi:hypothetical protein